MKPLDRQDPRFGRFAHRHADAKHYCSHVHALEQDVLPGTRPLSVWPATARKLINEFLRKRKWCSATGGTLWIIVEYCREQQLRGSLLQENGGWLLELAEEPQVGTNPSIATVWRTR